MIQLVVIKGEKQGVSFEVSYPHITIGRSDQNTIHLSDYHISSEHAQIFWEDDQYIFKDLRSTNGSVIERNGELITLDSSRRWEYPIKTEDRLLLGAPYNPVVLECRQLTPPSGVQDPTVTTRIVAAKSMEEITTIHTRAETDQNLAAVMYRMVQTIGRGGLELEKVFKSVSEAVFNLITRSTNVTIFLKERDVNRYRMMYTVSRSGREDNKSSKSLLQLVLKRKEAVVVADAPEELSQSESILAAEIRSIMAVPFWNGNNITGVLQCDNREKSGLFNEKDLEYLTLLSYQANLAIENARLYSQLKENREKVQIENNYLRKRTPVLSFSDIIGESPRMKRIFEQLEKVLDTRVSIHIHGETGTGKEVIATAIHYQSKRRDKMFVAQNCAALPETLLESELFGHVRGAFTGADKDKKGLFEIADCGTLFLDEIADMSPSLQVKLLRVLQEGEIRPLGSTEVKYVDVRIISATHKSLEDEVAKGNFREDLFYRLHVFPIHLPALRERREDIPLLIQHFANKYCRELNKEVRIEKNALDEMIKCEWKGNIRELENEVHRMIILADNDGSINACDLSPHQRTETALIADQSYIRGESLKQMMENVEKQILLQALGDHDFNKTNTAKTLGITREGLHKKISKYEIS
ncbi:sigma 54-interacting transcriptional regulator [Myxococcota bacterium]|nr:sigma 54-interacting transcriptional regulator [Myxococcota bacterium]MBU1381020.1 sigma 54-interacting transcriptional regulator [Myxococcota bacterium]MBU1497421.1 sigma 54-interacting transcriptional regulator [Myxococcota bacterium]